ncbi:hypothetical protein DL98DRAFT_538054 [Cadophora sp. DSE1049]|nr:hypothetical protein DL98DRAFT_538054 [Cadophora sp. DSE1049]
MCITRQHCSICEKHFDRFAKDCPSECLQYAEATYYEHSKYLGRESGWCLAISIVCYKCSKITDGGPMTPKTKRKQAGAWKRMLRAKLMVKKRDAEDARLEEKKRLEAKEKAKAMKDAVVWRKKAEEVVAFAIEAESKTAED